MTLTVPGSDSSATEQPPGRGWSESAVAPAGRRLRPAGDLAIRTDQNSNRCVLWLRGSLCADTVSVLDGHVDRLGCRWCDEVVVDLGDLVLMDRVGARLLVGLGHYVAGRGGRFLLQGAGPALQQMIDSAEAEAGQGR